MLKAKSTPNHAGVYVMGDYEDLYTLYEALHDVVGEGREEDSVYYPVALRVLGVCYDIRHAFMASREVELVDNQMDEDKMKWHSMITPEKNVYYGFLIVWTEAVFVVMALNDFVLLRAKELSKNDHNFMLASKVVYDKTIVQTRQFQTIIMEALAEVISPHSYARIMNLMTSRHLKCTTYLTQYLDRKTIKYLSFSPEKRMKNLSAYLKHIVEPSPEYDKIKEDIVAFARYNQCLVSEVRLKDDKYPEYIEW